MLSVKCSECLPSVPVQVEEVLVAGNALTQDVARDGLPIETAQAGTGTQATG